jgi:hypothetical protein
MSVRFVAVVAMGALAITACRDISGFSTHGDRYQGAVIDGDFVRAGVDAGTMLCLTLDTDHLEDGPGNLWTSDGRFAMAALRPIPQLWHDPLSTLSFGEGRLRNLVYVVGATAPFADGDGDDVFVVISLMQSGGVEVRLLRGAPGSSGAATPDASDGGASGSSQIDNVFAVFTLSRQPGPCQ